MDRFIDVDVISVSAESANLKSNMDRFIDTLKITPNDLLII